MASGTCKPGPTESKSNFSKTDPSVHIVSAIPTIHYDTYDKSASTEGIDGSLESLIDQGDELSMPSAVDVPKAGDKSEDALYTKSSIIGDLNSSITDSQKIAYAGLCYVILNQHQRLRFARLPKALEAFREWSSLFMEKLFAYLEVDVSEKKMIRDLCDHGLQPSDLSRSLLPLPSDGQGGDKNYSHPAAATSETLLPDKKTKKASLSSLNLDFTEARLVILSHLFLICISDGFYDARSRSLLKVIGRELQLPIEKLAQIEFEISNQLVIYGLECQVRPDENVIGKRNARDGKNRWLLAGLATLAGGAVIGLTAGLAAPFIASGVAAAFGANVAFLSGGAGLVLITGTGALTGGGMSAAKMLKRTKGIEEFEFLSTADALKEIEENKMKRDQKRREAKLTKLSAHSSNSEAKVVAVTTAVEHQLSQSDLMLANPLSVDKLLKEGSLIPEIKSVSLTCLSSNVKTRQTNVLITLAGWVTTGKDDHTFPFSTLKPNTYGDQYSLIWETKVLQELGSALQILMSEVASFLVSQGLQVTILPLLMGALTGPMWLMKLTYLLDNPWGIGLTKAQKCGRVLADILQNQVQENRPVTLIGFSLGARAIFYCLLELAAMKCYGVIEDVYLFGCPVLATPKEWENVASVVSGRLVNGYCTNDTVLGVLYRASMTMWKDVAGLRPIESVARIENVELDSVIKGHLDYRVAMPKILHYCGFHVTQDYFEDEEYEIQVIKNAEEIEKKAQVDAIARKELRRKQESESRKLDPLIQSPWTSPERVPIGDLNVTGVDFSTSSHSLLSPIDIEPSQTDLLHMAEAKDMVMPSKSATAEMLFEMPILTAEMTDLAQDLQITTLESN